ncbi:MAG TPA: response regulator [Candidatus Thermoplasmatota archaeon]|nr:response regulator [Candidatus Thermoplasmatota archaeon]
MSRTFLVVDRSAPIRMAVVAAIERREGSAARVFEAETVEDAMAKFLVRDPDVVFFGMPLAMDPARDIDVVRVMLDTAPTTKVVLLSVHGEEHPLVQQAFDVGAAALVRKPVRDAALEGALDQVAPVRHAFVGRIAPLVPA